MDPQEQIEQGQCSLGIELGSTRIKAVLVDPGGEILAGGSHAWENTLLSNGIWSYSLTTAHSGLQAAYQDLKLHIQTEYGCTLRKLKSLGISAMMHGYLVFDGQDRQLAEFRTWRNTTTGEAAAKLSRLFQYNIPQRWSVAHLYQAILDDEAHVRDIAHMTTLAGYIHWRLSGQKLLGIGDASGVFPVDLKNHSFDTAMLVQFDELHSHSWKLNELLPGVLLAGQAAGRLSASGASLLDPEHELEGGVLLCPPEGDAGTGMVATNSVVARTGNVSAGTSVFAMIVLEKPLSQMRREIDLVSTPDGLLVGMAHCNNGSSDLDAWLGLLAQAGQLLGAEFTMEQLYDTLFRHALEQGEADCGGLLHYGYVAGEDLTEVTAGRPLFVRSPSSPLDLANFIRSQLYSSLCALRLGLDILTCDEGVVLEDIRGHGGFFKTPGVGQRIVAAATATPVTVLQSAGEGGAWGIALLAAYAAKYTETKVKSSLPEFLRPIFASRMSQPLAPDLQDLKGFQSYFEHYLQGLSIERTALETLSD